MLVSIGKEGVTDRIDSQLKGFIAQHPPPTTPPSPALNLLPCCLLAKEQKKVKCKKGRLKDFCQKCNVKFKLHAAATSISWLSISSRGEVMNVERETYEMSLMLILITFWLLSTN